MPGHAQRTLSVDCGGGVRVALRRRLPHRIVTAAGDRVVDELSFTEALVNPPLHTAAVTE